MRELRYESPSGTTIELEDVRSALAGQALDLRGSEWSYTLGRASAYGMSRRARTAKVDVTFTRLSAADEALDLFDADVEAGTPGTLVADGRWRQAAYVLAADPKRASLRDCAVTLTVALLGGGWHTSREQAVGSTPRRVGGIDLPCGLPLDLGWQSVARPTVVTVARRAMVGVRAYGPGSDPAVTLASASGASLSYGVRGAIGAGEVAVIDPLASGIGRCVRVVGVTGESRTAFPRRTPDALARLAPGRYVATSSGCSSAVVDVMETSGGVPWS